MAKKFQLFIMLTSIIIFISLLFFLWRGLYMQPEILPSALIGKPTPHFHLNNLLNPTLSFTEQNLKGQVTLLHIWASWCSACEIEHPMLMEIKRKYNIPIYGITYKDNSQHIKHFLETLGNPYIMIGNDKTGEIAMDWGVYGTPETFIINKQGTIVYRQVGALHQQTWEHELLPLIHALQQ